MESRRKDEMIQKKVSQGWASRDIQKVHRVESPRIAAVDEISQAVDQTWESLEQRTIDGLVSDFKRRCQLVLVCKGESISGVLSSHMSTSKNMISTFRSRSPGINT